MKRARSARNASQKASSALREPDCLVCRAVNEATCVAHQFNPDPAVFLKLDAFLNELFCATQLPTAVFEVCMALQAKGIKAKGQSEILYEHAMLHKHPHSLIASIVKTAEAAHYSAHQDKKSAYRPPKNSHPTRWYFQSTLRKTWSRWYAKKSGEKRVNTQLALQALRPNTRADFNEFSATSTFASRLVSISATLQTPPSPTKVRSILSTFARVKRSGRLRKRPTPSPAPLVVDERFDDIDWLHPILELEPSQLFSDAGVGSAGVAQLPHRTRHVDKTPGSGNVKFVPAFLGNNF